MKLLTELFDYQLEAVEKLVHVKVGALYAYMGTGKTRMALDLIYRRLTAGKIDHVIWLCPTSAPVKRNLLIDIKKHAEVEPGLITICGIETLSTSYKENVRLRSIAQQSNCFLIVDESLLVKNPFALRSRHISRLAEFCPYRLILNGTPISKCEADLFSQWYILDWRILGYKSFYSFAANHLEYDPIYKDKIRRVLNVDYLTDKIAPYTVQIGEEVLNLPPKHSSTFYFSLTEEQETEYYRVRDDFLSLEVLHSDYESTIIYRTFNALQQVTSGHFIATPAWKSIRHFPLFDDPEENPRMQTLLNVIDREIPEGEKIIIWCKFEHEILDIQRVLESRGESVALCHGKIRSKKRAEEMEKFETGARFFLANKKCAQFGLNLQFCCYEIFYNNDWDWATREQAEDRIWRHGQTQKVHIIDICADSKIDERILSCVFRKANLAQEFKEHMHKKNFAEWLDGKDELVDFDRTYRKTKTG